MVKIYLHTKNEVPSYSLNRWTYKHDQQHYPPALAGGNYIKTLKHKKDYIHISFNISEKGSGKYFLYIFFITQFLPKIALLCYQLHSASQIQRRFFMTFSWRRFCTGQRHVTSYISFCVAWLNFIKVCTGSIGEIRIKVVEKYHPFTLIYLVPKSNSWCTPIKRQTLIWYTTDCILLRILDMIPSNYTIICRWWRWYDYHNNEGNGSEQGRLNNLFSRGLQKHTLSLCTSLLVFRPAYLVVKLNSTIFWR